MKCDALTPFWNVNHLTIDIISYILSQIPRDLPTEAMRKAGGNFDNTAYPNFHRRIS